MLILTSCEKYNQINNAGVVQTPYVLYSGGLDGSLHVANDTSYFKKLFPIDDIAVRQIITADTNILYLKGNCYFSQDEGRAFNICNANALPYYDFFYKYYLPHQMIYHAPTRKVFLCTTFGLAESADLGKTFSNAGVGIIPTSVAQLTNGDIFVIQDDATIYRSAAGTGPWTQVPPGSATLAAGTDYYLTGFGNTLVATDFEGVNGSYYSTNGGADWTKYGAVSGNGRPILFVNNPKGSSDLFLGRDSMGLFKLDGTGFVPSGKGIPWYAKVQYVEGKKLIFRTGVERYYLFCATDVGLYVSESGGEDWRLIRPGRYSTLH